jgi:hypothetical protein
MGRARALSADGENWAIQYALAAQTANTDRQAR